MRLASGHQPSILRRDFHCLPRFYLHFFVYQEGCYKKNSSGSIESLVSPEQQEVCGS